MHMTGLFRMISERGGMATLRDNPNLEDIIVRWVCFPFSDFPSNFPAMEEEKNKRRQLPRFASYKVVVAI